MNVRFLPLLIGSLGVSALAAQPFENWGYWLTKIDPEVVHNSEYDMVVVDYSVEGINEFSPRDVQHMKSRDGQPDRTVISYFSIGEAEEYRYYWDNDWKKIRPPGWMKKTRTGRGTTK